MSKLSSPERLYASRLTIPVLPKPLSIKIIWIRRAGACERAGDGRKGTELDSKVKEGPEVGEGEEGQGLVKEVDWEARGGAGGGGEGDMG